MNDFLAIAAQNTVAAAVLAVVVYGVTRVCRRPPVAHVLWLVVLVKLIGPPIVPVAWLAPLIKHPAANKPAPNAGIESPGVTREPAPATLAIAPMADPTASRGEPAPVTASEPALDPASVGADDSGAHWTPSALFDMVSDYFWMYWNQSKAAIFFAWMAGFVLCGAIGLRRALRFDSMLQGTLRAPERLQALAAELARKLAVARVPDLRLVDGCRVPLIWCFRRRPIIVLPTRLVHELDDEQMSMVLAHELAHLRRRDHWVRGVEFLVSVLYWWNPLVWWVRRQLHAVEELCCDAWVEWLYPDCKKRYAEVLFKAATFAGAAPRRDPALATGFLNQGSLQSRIEAILAGRLSRQLSQRAALILVAAALVLLPSFERTAVPAGTPNAQSAIVKRATGAKPADAKTTGRRRGKIVGKVTVEGTDEPVSGAVLSATLGTMSGRNYDSVTAKSDANGNYSLDVPFGNVAIWPWTFRWPAGYWSNEKPANVVLAADSPVVTKNFELRRGPVWRIRVRNAVSRDRLPGIRCTVTPLDGRPRRSFAETGPDGIANVTLPGFHGRFSIVVFDEQHRGKFELASVSLSIDPGFQLDRARLIVRDKQKETFKLTDIHGKSATLQNAPDLLVDAKLLVEVDLKPTASEGQGAVRGSIFDRDGRPVAGGRVEAAQTNEDGAGFITGMAATSAADGRFEIASPGIRSGGAGAKLSLIVTKEAYGGIETSPRELPETRGTPLDFGRITLLPGKSVRVRVVDAAGELAAGAWVEPRGGYAEIVESRATDERGECVLRNLPSGMEKVSATFGTSYGNAIVFPANEPATVTLRLKQAPKLESTATNKPRPLALGTPAPPLTVAGWSDDKSRTLADYRGKVVVLDFWGTWCGPCVRMLPVLRDLEHKENEVKQKDASINKMLGTLSGARIERAEVVFLSVHTAGTEMDQVREFQRQMKYNFVTALDTGDDVNDGATTKAYAVRGYPTVFIIDRDGRIAWSTDQTTPTDRQRDLKRAAHALSIPWPIDEKQPKEKLAAQMNRIHEYLFGEAIDSVLAKR